MKPKNEKASIHPTDEKDSGRIKEDKKLENEWDKPSIDDDVLPFGDAE